jgi:hypothetical protein
MMEMITVPAPSITKRQLSRGQIKIENIFALLEPVKVSFFWTLKNWVCPNLGPELSMGLSTENNLISDFLMGEWG